MRWVSSGVPTPPRAMLMEDRVIALRVVRCHCSHSWGEAGLRSACRSRSPQVVQRPSCEAGAAVCRGWLPASPVGPVGPQGGIVGGRGAFDHLVPFDLRPGELGEVGAAVAVPEHPLIGPGRVEPAEVSGGDPALRFVRVGPGCPLVGELPQVVIQAGEHCGGHHAPVEGRELARWRWWTVGAGACVPLVSRRLCHSRALVLRFRFQLPPFNPDMRFSLIRLTDVLHLEACAVRLNSMVPVRRSKPRLLPDLMIRYMP
jgi:hypothetical protein